MAKKPNVPPPVEVMPSIQGQVSAIASAHAPFLFFDSAPTYGALNGIIQIALEVRRIMPTVNGAGADRVIVAHLVMNANAALSLKAAIDASILLIKPAAPSSH